MHGKGTGKTDVSASGDQHRDREDDRMKKVCNLFYYIHVQYLNVVDGNFCPVLLLQGRKILCNTLLLKQTNSRLEDETSARHL